jgi:hypothetical protein
MTIWCFRGINSDVERRTHFRVCLEYFVCHTWDTNPNLRWLNVPNGYLAAQRIPGVAPSIILRVDF